jgi:hypothetical protein
MCVRAQCILHYLLTCTQYIVHGCSAGALSGPLLGQNLRATW